MSNLQAANPLSPIAQNITDTSTPTPIGSPLYLTDLATKKMGIGIRNPANLIETSGAWQYSTGTVTRAGNIVTGAGGATFTPLMVGSTLVFNDGTTTHIIGFIDSTHLTVADSGAVASQGYNILYPGFNIKSDGRICSTEKVFNVLDYGASGAGSAQQSTTGRIASGSTSLKLESAIDFANGQWIMVAGAGASGGNLITTIVSGGGTTTLTLNTAASTTISSAGVYHAIGSINSGSPTLTLTAASTFQNGQGIIVIGAGYNGGDLITTIISGGGTTNLTLATNALTTAAHCVVDHDDRCAMQRAIDAAAAMGGAEVFVPKGTNFIHGITGTITTTSTTQVIDTSKNFASLGVVQGDVVINFTRGCAAVVQSLATTTNPNDTLVLYQIDSTNRIVGNLGNNTFTSGDYYGLAGLVIKRNVHLKGQEGFNWATNIQAFGANSFTVITADPGDVCSTGFLPFRISDLTITRDGTAGQWNTDWMLKNLGGSGTTYLTISKSGSTVTYAYSSGTALNFETNGMKIGDIVVINATTFDDRNNGTFVVTDVSDSFFKIVNNDGFDQSARLVSSASEIKSGARDYDHAINAFNYRIWEWGLASPCNFSVIERVTISGAMNPYVFSTGIRLACWFDASIKDCMVSYCRTGIDISMPGTHANSANVLNCQAFDNKVGIRLAGLNNKVIGGQIMADARVNCTFLAVGNPNPALHKIHTNYIAGVSFEGSVTDLIGIHLMPESEATTITGCWFNLAGPGIRPEPGKVEIKDNSNGRNNVLANYFWGSYCGIQMGWANEDWKAASNLNITGEGSTSGGGGRVDNAGSSTTVQSKLETGAGNVNPSKLLSNGASTNNLVISGGTGDFRQVQPGWQIWVNSTAYNVVQKYSNSSIIIDQYVTITPAQTWKCRPNKTGAWRYVVAGGATAFSGTDYGYKVHFVTLNADATVLYKIDSSHIVITDTPSMLGANDTWQYRIPLFKNVPLYSTLIINGVGNRYLIGITDDFTATMSGAAVDLSAGYYYSIVRNDAKLTLNGGALNGSGLPSMFVRAGMTVKDRYDLPGIMLNRWTGVNSNYSNARIGQSDLRGGGHDLVIETGATTGGDLDTVAERMRVTTDGKFSVGGIIDPKATLHSTGSTIVGAATAAVANADMGNGQLNFWVDQTNNRLYFKVKYSTGGTPKSGYISLA